ncbi:MAG TPA: hypothetical protein VK806_00715 [Bacteroidia bacterium]|nr:hypothetical protein [Bacteroidia bacterium]
MLLSIGLASCKQLDPPETIPAYMRINSVQLTTTPAQGSNSANIDCAWVYIDDNPVGAFPLPCTFPIVASNGTHKLMVISGIENDGISAQRKQYPFYTNFEENVTLTQGQTITVSPKVDYTSYADFHFMENFENSFILLTPNPNKTQNNDTMVTTNVGAFQGRSGLVVMCGANNRYEGDIDTLFNLPKDGSTDVYLEFNYKSDAPFSVGMYYGSVGNEQTSIVFVDSSATWNKMYVELEPTIIQLANTTVELPFYIYFNTQLPSGMDTARFMLDNIKVVQ